MAKRKPAKQVAENEAPSEPVGRPTDVIRRLTDRQKAFVREYLIDRNATAAYKRAGYKDSPAAQHHAARLVANGKVRAAIAAMTEKVAERAEISAAYVLGNLQEVVERCMQRAPVMLPTGDQMRDDDGKHVWTFNAKSAVAALVALGNHLDLFKSKGKPAQGTSTIEIVRITVAGPSAAVPAVSAADDASL